MGKIYKNNVLYTNYTAVHSGFTPVGTVISVMSNHAPANYLICDGSVYNISAYPELANHFATEFGSKNYFGGDGTTTFAVPDLRGEFLRGAGTNSHENQGNGGAVGEHQDGTEIPNMAINTSANGNIGIKAVKNNEPNYIEKYDYKDTGTAYNMFAGATKDTSTGGYITPRPTNTSVLLCIAVKNIFMDAGSNYSTEEQVVGTWIDGKPIYQKTITGTISALGTWNEYNHGISNLGTCVDIKGIASMSGGYQWVFTGYRDYVTYMAVSISSTKVRFFVSNSDTMLNQPIHFTIQYTKTTD